MCSVIIIDSSNYCISADNSSWDVIGYWFQSLEEVQVISGLRKEKAEMENKFVF